MDKKNREHVLEKTSGVRNGVVAKESDRRTGVGGRARLLNKYSIPRVLNSGVIYIYICVCVEFLLS